jgi:hypothetical protein
LKTRKNPLVGSFFSALGFSFPLEGLHQHKVLINASAADIKAGCSFSHRAYAGQQKETAYEIHFSQ